jgi:1-deoxy-D-xylulose-5-phosphate synthase
MQQTPWLKKIHSPADLKGLRVETLRQLASEIRGVIADTCSANGGHFAPSLGVVELTLALHSVFDAPRDKIVWDVGHQAYPHKLLTGRLDRFHTLRTLGGISGFPRRDESPCDAFGVGHASTAISAALGMALARDLRGEHYRVVAVCGDGAMTGGLCYEALNNLGYQKPNMLVVLNDNEMSISANIGAMARYFNQFITTGAYNRFKDRVRTQVRRLPWVGETLVRITHKLEGSIKNLILPQETIFEKMGIRYIGPVDGHDLPELLNVLAHVRDLTGPVLLHVKTVKGKGYAYSESEPERWHSNRDFDVATGEKVAPTEGPSAEPPAPGGPAAPPTYTEVFGRTLVEMAERDRRIVAITAAMPAGTGLTAFARRYGPRFFDVGIAEEHAVCCAAGMASEGMRPVVAIYSTFLQRAFDQIVHDVALQSLPVTFAIDRAGVVGDDGPTHHGVFDLSYLRMIPGMVVMAPRDEAELRRMMATAAAHESGPIAYRYPRSRGVGVSLEGPAKPLEIGRGELLREPSEGLRRDVAILTIGTMAASALGAAALLEAEGLGVAVADMRFVKPLDQDLLERLAGEYGLLVTVEENVVSGGFGSAVAEALAASGLAPQGLVTSDSGASERTASALATSAFVNSGLVDSQLTTSISATSESAPSGRFVLPPVLTLGLPDAWLEQGPIGELLSRCGLDAPGIAASIRARVQAVAPVTSAESENVRMAV